jgi:hypothetical protein
LHLYSAHDYGERHSELDDCWDSREHEKAPTPAALAVRHGFFGARWTMGIGLLFSLNLVGGKQRRAGGLCMLLMLMFVVLIPSCGGGGGGGNQAPSPNPGRPIGVYNVVVSATGGSTVSKTGFLVVVQ